MQPIAIVKHRYVVQHILLCFESRLVIAPMDSLLLQTSEEALGHSAEYPSNHFCDSYCRQNRGLSVIAGSLPSTGGYLLAPVTERRYLETHVHPQIGAPLSSGITCWH